MERNERFLHIGAVFYFLTIAHLLSTREGLSFLRNVSADIESTKIIIMFLAVGVGFFTSSSVGFVFGSFARCFWDLSDFRNKNGYSVEFEKYLKTDIRKYFYDNTGITLDLETDVVLSFFLTKAPDKLISWVERRLTAFFMFRSMLLSMLSSSMIVLFLDYKYFELSVFNYLLFFASILFAVSLWIISVSARRAVHQMIDLWVSSKYGDHSSKIKELETRFLSQVEGQLPN